ncbi:MAG: metallophosphoesterase [Spirochaetales bacterium]|nr:metallophosphoesterase [Spirochaetales bacterium]
MRIAILGDIHGFFSEEDIQYFNHSTVDLILLVGDLPGRLHRFLPVCRLLSRLRRRTLLIPGNHDATSIMQVIAEIRANRSMIERHSPGQEERVAGLRQAIAPVEVCGYSRHTVAAGADELDIIAGRPHSMGGAELGFQPYLKRCFGVADMADSLALYRQRIDESTLPLLFLAHNGPAGLGDRANDIWGCDFRKAEDFGDPDLAAALEYARTRGRVLGVVAGHMHHRLKGGGERTTFLFRDGIFYLNAARVPRIYTQRGRKVRYHIEMQWQQNNLVIEEVLLGGQQILESRLLYSS